MASHLISQLHFFSQLTVLRDLCESFARFVGTFPPILSVRTLGSLFYNSRHRVMSLACVWVNGMTGLANGGSHFRMRITLGVVLIRSLVFHVCVSECVVICGFKRNSSKLDRAPKMRDSALLNSWGSFSVTLLSISSETYVIYSSLILGTDVFRDWPFLGFSSCVSLVTAANFRLFLNVAIFLKGKCYAVMKTELFCIC